MTQAPDIIETLRYVADTVDVPAPDETELRRRVRGERHAAIRRRAAAVAAAASMVVAASAAGFLVDLGQGGDPRVETPVAGPPRGVVAEDRPPVYLSVSGRLHALDPTGEIHDLDVGVEEIVGATPDGVLAVDRESHLVRFRAVEGDTGWRFERVDPPVEEAVQGAAVSSASGLVAWLSLDDELVAYDLKADRRVEEMSVSRGAAVLGVGTGVLFADGDEVLLTGRDGATVVPWEFGRPGRAATGRAVVALSDGGRARVYQVTDTQVDQVAEFEGTGALSPDGAAYLAAPHEEDGGERAVLWERRGGVSRPLEGLAGTVTEVAWAGVDTAVVASRLPGQGGRTDVYTCDVATATCALAMAGGDSEVYLR
jgi:hypothetical protein